MTQQQKLIEFGYDIVCPWAYIASRRIESVASKHGAKIIWTPVLLGGIYDLVNAEFGKNNSASVAFSKTKAAYSARDFRRTVARWNVPLRQHPKHPVRTVKAGRLLWACPESHRAVLTHALYKAYWVDNLDVSSDAVLQGVLDAAVPELRLSASVAVEDERNKELLRVATEVAVKRGTPGVPAIFIPDSRLPDGGRMFWGGDRLHFVEGALAALDQPTTSLVAVSMPRFTRGPLTRPKTLRMWFDFSSPWTYLGWTQVGRILEEAGPLCSLELRPTLLGIVFKEIGTPVVPSLVVSKQKREYSGKDLLFWVDYWNNLPYPVSGERKPVRFQFNSNFPLRTPIALRMVTAIQSEGAPLADVVKLIDTLYHACWADNIAVSDKNPQPLVKYLDYKGFDGALLLKKAQSSSANELLRKNTAEAVQTGVCGFPSFQVDGGELFWGQDRLDVLADHLFSEKSEQRL
ncbi:thioredoxin-like protein [Gonapodya prolifera JEL478]|uniref:Thioredoxin-like protein n=1 Tax=Gonapodya prolifera (strain JEL478) TaxID=1344416 RepID=A0A139A978_GONPJ|nr:thioredoxin-like protein [Gonapodya prolifera JEL478]|eukprot:KXS12953.1 thioredoxin-like protein [Gonapodya prolifera JEL478]